MGKRVGWVLVWTVVPVGAVALMLGWRGLLQALSIGLQYGAVYSFVGLGVALVYKATKVLNFAQGELGTVPAFVAYVILVPGGFAARADIGAAPRDTATLLAIASLAAIVTGAVLAILVNVLVVRRLASASPVTSLVATAGVALMLTSLELVAFDAQARNFPRYINGGFPCLSEGCEPLRIAGITIPWHTVVVIAVLAVTSILLAIFFRTRAGVALLATAQEPFAAQLQGISVGAMSTLAWGTAGALAAIGGLLAGGVFEQLTPGLMTTTFLIPAFTGAVLGGLTSMAGAVVGGLLLGVIVAVANSAVLEYDLSSVIPGPPQVATFAVLILVLTLRPRGLLGKEA